MSAIIEITNKQEFLDFSKENLGYAVVDFYATWCGPCKMMMPIFERLSKDSAVKSLKFIKVDRDLNNEWIKEFGFDFRTIPRFFLIKLGNSEFQKSDILLELGGSQGKTDLLNKLDEYSKENDLNLLSDLSTDTTAKPMIENNHSEKPKVAIIGSGPAGLTAGIYASRAELNTTIFLGFQPGGQLTTTTEIENFPGAWNFETKQGMMGPDLMSLIQKQAEHFGAKTMLAEVSSIQVDKVGEKPVFTVTSGKGEEKFDAVIIATGASAKYLGIPGEERFVGKGYHSCATCDGFFYRDKEIAVVGGGDTAMEEANFLTKFAKKVYLIHRRDEFRASKVMQERVLSNPKVEVIWNTVITDFVGEEKVTAIKLESTVDGKASQMPIDGVFVAIGHVPNSGFIGELLDKDNTGYLIPEYRKDGSARVSKFDMATTVPGIFVAGDIEDHTYRQAITAAADGCKAAMDCEKWLEQI